MKILCGRCIIWVVNYDLGVSMRDVECAVPYDRNLKFCAVGAGALDSPFS